jgi:hypothetical protein
MIKASLSLFYKLNKLNVGGQWYRKPFPSVSIPWIDTYSHQVEQLFVSVFFKEFVAVCCQGYKTLFFITNQ